MIVFHYVPGLSYRQRRNTSKTETREVVKRNGMKRAVQHQRKWRYNERLSYHQKTRATFWVIWNVVNSCTNNANWSLVSLRSTFCNNNFIRQHAMFCTRVVVIGSIISQWVCDALSHMHRNAWALRVINKVPPRQTLLMTPRIPQTEYTSWTRTTMTNDWTQIFGGYIHRLIN